MTSTLNLNAAALREFQASTAEPFCNQRFKIARVLANDALQALTFVFFDNLSSACWMFNTNLANRFKSKADYQLEKGLQTARMLRYGKQIIDFSVNRATKTKESSPTSTSELEALKKAYNLRELDWQPFYGNAIDQNKLKRLDVDDGCCAGMSAHFILCYLKQIQEGKTPLEAVQQASPMYVNGAPETAQLAQIFQKAIKCGPTLEQKGNECTSEIRKAERIYLLRKSLEILFFPITLVITILNSLYKYLSQSKSNLIELASLNQINVPLQKFKEYCDEIIRRPASLDMMGLTVDKMFGYKSEKMKTDLSEVGMNQFIQTLPNGAYNVILTPEDVANAGHAIVFIKTEEEGHFLFDSNHATLSLDPENSGKELWKLANRYYPQSEGACEISFRHCHLKG